MKTKYILLLSTLMSICLASCNPSNLPSDSDSPSISETESSNSESSNDSETNLNIDDFNTTPKSEEYRKQGYYTLFKDINHKYGYIVTKPSYGAGESPYHSEYLKLYPEKTRTPSWTIAQWSSRFDIMGKDANSGYTHETDETGLIHTITSKGGERYYEQYPGKKVIINSMDGSLYFESNCGVEYLQDRTGSEGWVHLLMSQDFDDRLVFIKDLKSLMLETNYKVTKFEDMTYGKVNPNAHAAQFVFYITIQNRNKSSVDYGKYIWFGLGLWDNRSVNKFTSIYSAHDAGTDTLIYSPGSTDFMKTNSGRIPKVGVDAQAKVDILPIVQKAYEDGIKKGYLGTTKWEELAIGGMNFGFEVPGTYNIGTEIKDIGIYYK